MSDRLSMDEIRAFLLKSDAVEEAEGILVDSMLKRSHDSSTALRRPVVKRPADVTDLQVTSATSIDTASTNGSDISSSSNRLDYLKIHDLLSSIDDGGATRGRNSRNFISSDQRPQQDIKTLSNQQPNKLKLLELQSIEESATEELSELQSRRELLQDRVVSTRSELERQRILYNSLATGGGHIDKSDHSYRSSTMHKRLSGHVEQEVQGKNKASMTQIFELTQQHAKKLALNSVKSMEYQRELGLIRAGDWSIDKSYLRNATRASIGRTSSQAVAAVPSVTEITATASQQAQAEEIHELRRQAAAHRSALQLQSDDPLLRQLEDVITSKDRWRQVTVAAADAPRKESSKAAGVVSSSTKLYLDRRESASDYLDRWLLLDSGSSAAAAALGEAPRTAAAVRAGDGAQVADDINRTVTNLQADPSSSSSPNRRIEIRGRSADQLNALQRQGLSTLNILRDEAEEERMMPNRPLQPPLQQYSPQHPSPLQQYHPQQNPHLQQYHPQQNPLLHQYSLQPSLPLTQHPNPQLFPSFPQYPPVMNQSPHPFQPYQQHSQQSYPYPYPYPTPSYNPPHFQQHVNPHALPLFQQHPPPQNPSSQRYPDQQAPPWQQQASPLQNNPPINPTSYSDYQHVASSLSSDKNKVSSDAQKLLLDMLELENRNLLQQLGPKEVPDLIQKGSGSISARDSSRSSSYKNRGISDDDLYQLERDRRSGKIGRAAHEMLLTRDDIKHADEMRKMDHEIERILGQQKLDEVRAEYSKRREDRESDLKHQKWLTQSKQELQHVKLQQVLEKEQRLLMMRKEESALQRTTVAGFEGNANAAGVDELKVQSGVGLRPVSFDLLSGVTVIADGVILPSSAAASTDDDATKMMMMTAGTQFRIALGVYDRNGASLQRLTASEWQDCVVEKNTTDISNLQSLNSLVLRSIDIKSTIGNLKESRTLLELQIKDPKSSKQSSVGWGIATLLRSSGNNTDNYNANGVSGSSYSPLNNNAWRAPLRRGITDPAIPSRSISDPSAAASAVHIPGAWLLFRIVESKELTQATSWTLKSSSIRNEELALKFYDDTTRSQHKIRSDIFSAPSMVSAPSTESMRRLTPVTHRPDFLRDYSGKQRGFSRKSTTSRENKGEERMSPRGRESSSYNAAAVSAAPNRLNLLTEDSGDFDERSDDNNVGDDCERIETTLPSQTTSPHPLHDHSPSAKKIEDNFSDSRSSVDYDKSSFWYLGTPLGVCRDKYQQGDGVDVYIDAAMSLPDNCTVSRVSVRFFTAEKEQVGQVFEEVAIPGSASTSPKFHLKAELRQPSFNVTMTALVRIDTICSVTLLPSTVGYACCKVFSTRDRVQPTTNNTESADIYLNSGSIQLPLHGGKLSPPKDALFDEKVLSVMPKIPCAYILLRIVPAPKSSDGATVLSRNNCLRDDWGRMGLDIPAPAYSTGTYDGSLCEPGEKELICYRIKYLGRESSPSEEALLQAMIANSSTAETTLPRKPSGSSTGEIKDWFQKLFPPQDAMRRSIEYAFTAPYDVESGVSISIDKLYNMPDNSSIFSNNHRITLYKVVISTLPPGLFYKSPPIYDQVFYTKEHQLEAHWRAPSYLDGCFTFHPPAMSNNLFLIVDIRTIYIEDSDYISIEDPSSKKSLWSLLPLAMELVTGHGFKYVQSGIYHLPLFEGPVPADFLLKEASSSSSDLYGELLARLSSKGKASIKVIDGGMILLKVFNPLLQELVTKTEFNGKQPSVQRYFMETLLDAAVQGASGSSARKDRFVYDPTKFPTAPPNSAAKESTGAQLPKLTSNIPALMRKINNAFESKTGIHPHI